MILDAALGITAGAVLSVALAGARRVRNWQRAAAVVSVAGVVVVLLALASRLLPALGYAPAARLNLILIAFGGVALWARSVSTSSATGIAGGVLLVWATLAPGDGSAPQSFSAVAIGLGVVCLNLLPVADDAILEWRAMPGRARWRKTQIALISVVVVANAIERILENGMWFGSSPSEAWLLAAWVTGSAGLIMARGRPRAAVTLVAALTAAASALTR